MDDVVAALEARVAEIERTVGIRRGGPDSDIEAAVVEAEGALGLAPPDDDHGVAAAVAALVGGGAEIPGGEEGRPRSDGGLTVAVAGAGGQGDGAAPGTDSLGGGAA